MTMLVLSRKAGERIRVGENITVVVTKIAGNRVTIGIDAPDSMRIVREELPIADASVAASPAAETPAPESPVGVLLAVTLPASNRPTVESPTVAPQSVNSPTRELVSAGSSASPVSTAPTVLPVTSTRQTGPVHSVTESCSDDALPTVVATRGGGPRAPLAKIVRQRSRPQAVNVASRVATHNDRESRLAGAAQRGETTPSVTEVELSAVQLLSFAITTTF